MQRICAIYAVSENGIIGNKNDLPWHLPADFKYFKQCTQGKPIIMGRNTCEALGKPLVKRRNIVLTRQANYTPPADGFEVVHSWDEALAACADAPEIFIIGGAQIYTQAFAQNLVTHVYQTSVHADVEGDTAFSIPNPDAWRMVSVVSHQADAENEHAYTYLVLEK